jgi:hypothetical protein
MKTIHHAMILSPLLFMLGCAAIGDDAQESTQTDDLASASGPGDATLASSDSSMSPLAAGARLGPVQIIADNSGKCLDVRGGPSATGNGVPIQQWTCLSPAPSNQLWFLVDTGDAHSWYITAQNSGRCLDVRGGPSATGNGVNLQQWDCLGYQESNQRFIVQDNRNITAVHSGKCLDVRGGPSATGNGVPIQQWSCFSPTTANQRWRILTLNQ